MMSLTAKKAISWMSAAKGVTTPETRRSAFENRKD